MLMELEKFLELKNIRKNFGGVQALKGVDFDLYKGEIHCLVGGNGSGKSTLIKIISGVYQAEEGAEIHINGEILSHLTPLESINKGIQVIYQDLSLFPNLSVAENIGIGQYLEKGRMFVDRKNLIQRSEAAMNKIGISLPLEKTVGELSIADRQLVAICRAIANEARLVIMDEPTASLTRNEVDALFRVVRDLQSRKITILFVSHRLDEIMEIAQRVTVLRDGEKVGVYEASELDDHKLAFLMTGQQFKYEVNCSPYNKEEVILEVENLCKEKNYKDISFSLHEGEILGITGLLGSGRTELALSLFGANPPDSGEIRLDGRPVSLSNKRDAIAAGIGYVSEDRLSLGLILDQPADNNMILTIMDQILGKGNLIDREKKASCFKKWVNELNIKVSTPDIAVKTLSGGNQQKVVLSKWLATSPRILILDSPTVGVDIAAKNGLYQVVKDLALQGMGIIIISDEVPEVLYNCHRVLVMRKGHIVGECFPAQITEKELTQKINEY